MKSIFLIAISLLLSSCATMVWISVSTPKDEDIIDAKGTKNELYIRSNEWMVRNFNNSKSVIQFQDKEDGKILGKYLMNSETYIGESGIYRSPLPAIDVYSLISITVKDKTAKIEIEPRGEWKYDRSNTYLLNYSPERAKSDIKLLIESYRKYISSIEDVWKRPETKASSEGISDMGIAFYKAGAAKFWNQDYSGAIADFNKAIEDNPNYMKALYYRGLAELQTGQKNDACSDLSKAGFLGSAEAIEQMKKSCKN